MLSWRRRLLAMLFPSACRSAVACPIRPAREPCPRAPRRCVDDLTSRVNNCSCQRRHSSRVARGGGGSVRCALISIPVASFVATPRSVERPGDGLVVTAPRALRQSASSSRTTAGTRALGTCSTKGCRPRCPQRSLQPDIGIGPYYQGESSPTLASTSSHGGTPPQHRPPEHPLRSIRTTSSWTSAACRQLGQPTRGPWHFDARPCGQRANAGHAHSALLRRSSAPGRAGRRTTSTTTQHLEHHDHLDRSSRHDALRRAPRSLSPRSAVLVDPDVPSSTSSDPTISPRAHRRASSASSTSSITSSYDLDLQLHVLVDHSSTSADNSSPSTRRHNVVLDLRPSISTGRAPLSLVVVELRPVLDGASCLEALRPSSSRARRARRPDSTHSSEHLHVVHFLERSTSSSSASRRVHVRPPRRPRRTTHDSTSTSLCAAVRRSQPRAISRASPHAAPRRKYLGGSSTTTPRDGMWGRGAVTLGLHAQVSGKNVFMPDGSAHCTRTTLRMFKAS